MSGSPRALLAERFHREPTSKLHLVGVTGTKGKTTTTWILHQLLNDAGQRCGLIGTVCIDDGSELTPATLTTPPAMELSRTLAHMLDCGCRAAAMEVSSHALEQRRAAGLHFRIGIFTNLEHDHLDYHGTMDQYAGAKAKLFEMLPLESRGGLAIVNAMDPFARRMVRDCHARVLGCAVTPDAERQAHEPQRSPAHMHADCRAVILNQDATGSDVEMTGPWGQWSLRLPLVGAHNVMNAMQAAAAALEMGMAPSEIQRGLSRVKAPPGRMEPVTSTTAPFAVYVDYAHTEDSLRKVLRVARELVSQDSSGGRLLVIFGCGGDRDRAKRPRMGAAAAELADAVWVTSDNPRTEQPEAIIEEVLAGVPPSSRPRITVQPDRQRAIHSAIAAARSQDFVIIAGKGHEDYQILPDGHGGTVKRHFDDREVARQALADRGIGGDLGENAPRAVAAGSKRTRGGKGEAAR